MKTRKIKFMIEQVFFILLMNYLFVIKSGFIYKSYWLPTFAIATLFFHTGTFVTLYTTIVSKTLTKEKERLLFNFNILIYSSYLGLLFLHNCQVESGSLILNYCFGLYMLINVTVILFETYSSYIKYISTKIINNQN